MTDFFSRLVEMSRGIYPGVQPLITPLFAPDTILQGAEEVPVGVVQETTFGGVQPETREGSPSLSFPSMTKNGGGPPVGLQATLPPALVPVEVRQAALPTPLLRNFRARDHEQQAGAVGPVEKLAPAAAPREMSASFPEDGMFRIHDDEPFQEPESEERQSEIASANRSPDAASLDAPMQRENWRKEPGNSSGWHPTSVQRQPASHPAEMWSTTAGNTETSVGPGKASRGKKVLPARTDEPGATSVQSPPTNVYGREAAGQVHTRQSTIAPGKGGAGQERAREMTALPGLPDQHPAIAEKMSPVSVQLPPDKDAALPIQSAFEGAHGNITILQVFPAPDTTQRVADLSSPTGHPLQRKRQPAHTPERLHEESSQVADRKSREPASTHVQKSRAMRGWTGIVSEQSTAVGKPGPAPSLPDPSGLESREATGVVPGLPGQRRGNPLPSSQDRSGTTPVHHLSPKVSGREGPTSDASAAVGSRQRTTGESGQLLPPWQSGQGHTMEKIPAPRMPPGVQRELDTGIMPLLPVEQEMQPARRTAPDRRQKKPASNVNPAVSGLTGAQDSRGEGQELEAGPAPDIQVRIGRIDVRAVSPVTPDKPGTIKRSGPARPTLTLSAYLERRRRGES